MPDGSFDGLLVLDKPRGITSRDAVDRAQRWFPRRTRIGHTGTLDPLATGVLVLCIGDATRLTEYVQRMGKTYRTTIRFGAVSDSDDADGTITPRQVEIAPTRDALDAALATFLGEIDQVPPAYSAAKVAGRRAYAMARSGEEVRLTSRRVRVDALNVLDYSYPVLDLEMHCGKGTYVRSLARDLGERLGCGGYVETLRRTRVGSFLAQDGLTLEAAFETARAALLPIERAVEELPRLVVSARTAADLRHGKAVPVEPRDGEAAVFDEQGKLTAIVEVSGTTARPVKVFGCTRQ